MKAGYTYIFPENEARRYAHHGLAIAKLKDMTPFPLGGCLIDVSQLMKDANKAKVRGKKAVDRPSAAWVKRNGDSVEILVSARGHTAPEKSSVRIDPTAEVESIRFAHHPKSDFRDIALEPIYKKVKEPLESPVPV